MQAGVLLSLPQAIHVECHRSPPPCTPPGTSVHMTTTCVPPFCTRARGARPCAQVNVLLSLHHANIVDVSEVVVDRNPDSVFMVMEFMDHELKALMEKKDRPFSTSEVRCPCWASRTQWGYWSQDLGDLGVAMETYNRPFLTSDVCCGVLVSAVQW